MVGSIYEPERVNSYIYAGNNPLVYMDRDGRSFTCKIINSRIFKKAVDVYETFKTVVDKVGSVVKPVVETVVKAYNDFNKFIDETPTCVKIAAGIVGGVLAAASGVSPIVVGATLLNSAVGGAVFGAAMYGLESISTGKFNKTDMINSMLGGALDMFFISGVVMGSKAVVDGIVRNAGRIQDALLANEETGITFSDEFVNSVNEKYSRFTNRLYSNEEGCSNILIKIDEFIENINGKIETSYGKSSEKSKKTLAEWLDDEPELLEECSNWYKGNPDLWSIDPDNTEVFYRTPEEVAEIRKLPGESGGLHPHGLALGGPKGQKLTITGETRKSKNPVHSKVTGLQRRVINVLREKE